MFDRSSIKGNKKFKITLNFQNTWTLPYLSEEDAKIDAEEYYTRLINEAFFCNTIGSYLIEEVK